MRRLIVVTTLAVASLCAPRASATPTSRLVYSRSSDAQSCPDEQALRREVAVRIGYDPFFPWATRTVVSGITRREAAFVATVDLVDEQGTSHGTRELHTDGECGELLGAMALAIAIAIDPQSLSRTSPAPAAPAPPPPPAAAPVVAATPPSEPAAEKPLPSPAPAPAPSAFVFAASAGAVASAGVAPNVAAGLALGGGVHWRFLSLSLEGRIDAPASSPAQGGGAVQTWLAVAGPVTCLYLGPVFGCAIGQVGMMQASGSGVLETHSTSVPWWAAGGRLGAVFPLAGDLRLRLRTDVVSNIDRATLRLNNADAWSPPQVATSVGLDLVLSFL